MNTPRICLALPLACVAAAGCMSNGPRLLGLNPFYQVERTTFVTPAKRLAEIRAVADKSTGADTPEQQALVEALVAPLPEEPDPLVRQAILETAAEFKTPLASRALLAGLTDDSPHVREAACRLLAAHPASGAVEALAARAHGDESFDVRVAAARALAPNGATPQQLLMLLEDPNPAMQLVGAEAMRSATGKDFGGDVGAYIALARGETPPERSGSVASRLPDWLPFR